MVTNLPKDGHQFSKGGSLAIPSMGNTIQRLIQRYGCIPSQGWSTTKNRIATTIPRMVITFPRTVTHHFQDGQLDLKFDSKAAQLVPFKILLNSTLSHMEVGRVGSQIYCIAVEIYDSLIDDLSVIDKESFVYCLVYTTT